MFSNLLIHPTTRRILTAYTKRPPHALLLIGPAEIGKLTLAREWAKAVTRNEQYYAQVVAPDDKDSIGIETIRELYRTSRSKHQERQIIIIDHAEAMSLEAQNAFLKLLEEPPEKVIFVLTVPYTTALLPTIFSRVQAVQVYPVSEEVLRNFLDRQTRKLPGEVNQLLFIAQGRPGLLAKLVTDTNLFQIERELVQQAKQLLANEPYQRLITGNKLAGDRTKTLRTLEAMQAIASLQLAKQQPVAQTKHWLQLADNLNATLQAIHNNGNVKVQLLKLLISY